MKYSSNKLSLFFFYLLTLLLASCLTNSDNEAETKKTLIELKTTEELKKTSESLMNQANQLYHNGELIKAFDKINKAIEIDSNSLSNYAVSGFINIDIGNSLGVIRDMTKIIELSKEGKNLKAHFHRGIAYYELNKFSKASKDIEYYITNVDPSDKLDLAEGYLHKATILYLQDSLSQSEKYYKKVIDIGESLNDKIEAQGLIGLSNISNNEEESLNYLDKAISIDVENSIAYSNRARIYQEIKDFSKALKDLRKARKLQPLNLGVNFDIGNYYLNMDNQDSAIFYYRKAISNNPKNYKAAEVYRELGHLNHRAGNMSEAIENYQISYSIAPNDKNTLEGLASALEDNNDLGKAMQIIEEAIKIEADTHNLNIKGNILLGQKKFNEAIESFKAAISKDEMFGGGYYNLGYTFGLMNKPDSAILYYKKAIQQQFDLKSTLVNNALQLFKINENEEACQMLYRAKKLGRRDLEKIFIEKCNK